MNDDTSSAGELPSGTFIGRDAFRERVRAGLSAAAAEGWAERLRDHRHHRHGGFEDLLYQHPAPG